MMFLTEKQNSQAHFKTVSISVNAFSRHYCHNRNMANRLKPDENRRASKLHLHAWLKKKKLTVEALADQLNTGKSVVSKLANGRQQYTQEWLERIAFIFDCEPTALLRDPDFESADEIISTLSDEARERALNVLKALK